MVTNQYEAASDDTLADEILRLKTEMDAEIKIHIEFHRAQLQEVERRHMKGMQPLLLEYNRRHPVVSIEG